MTQDTVETAEITNLNLDALDVAELERRLELATGDTGTAAWLCGSDWACDAVCNAVCNCNTVETCMPVGPSECLPVVQLPEEPAVY